MPTYIQVAIISYLCGSIPFGYLLVRTFKGRDVRQSGSGNIGATNVARTAPILGIATLLLDALKGFVAVVLSNFFDEAWMNCFGSNVSRPPWVLTDPCQDLTPVVAIAALFVILGHMFPVWLKFRGGKGVATAVGVFLALAPKALGSSLLVFLLVFTVTRYVSLASMTSSFSFPLFLRWIERVPPGHPVFISAVLISLLIILKHHSNIRRLLNGTESRFGRKKSAEALAEED